MTSNHGDTNCNCESDAEHTELVLRVNESYTRDPYRAKLRAERTTSFLRFRPGGPAEREMTNPNDAP